MKFNQKNALVRIMAGVLSVVMLLSLAACSKTDKTEAPKEETPAEEQTAPAETPVEETAVNAALHTNAYGYKSCAIHYEKNDDGETLFYYLDENGERVDVDAAAAETAAMQLVAKCYEYELNNVELGFYYDQQMYNLLSNYGNQLGYLMNYGMPMDEQLSPDGTQTWMDYLLDTAMRMFQQVAALCQAAEAEGFTLPEEDAEHIRSMLDGMNDIAVENGFENAEAYLQNFYGPFATLEAYEGFMYRNQLAAAYAMHLQDQIVISADSVEQYYDLNAEMFESYHIPKVDKNVISIRHILITPEDTGSDESWEAAKAEAQRIYDEWQANEPSEDSFAALAGLYSTDPGSAQNGGLYEEVYPGQMVEAFNDWCFEDGRAVGDSGIVETGYGYHIMFFAGEGDYIYWRMVAADYGRNVEATSLRQSVVDAYPLDTLPEFLAFFDPSVPTVPEAPAAE